MTDPIKDLCQELEKRYYLIPRSRLWALIGGAIAFLFAIGVVSYQAVTTAVAGTGATAAVKRIATLRDEAEALYKRQQDILAQADRLPNRIDQMEARLRLLDRLEADTRALATKVTALDAAAIKREKAVLIKAPMALGFVEVDESKGGVKTAPASGHSRQKWTLIPAE